ncbi:hypothetical protein OSB04_011375 [Centaurea solstitialis]|uniref:VLRF1 domain-containing protein n=1 Tax=Centaurea solstitialis TaxID=347529 RepID=A0AA38WQ16_9ASTR|nr:hypothetical protein OSB04_011375 [Centaurea solstitialis]
MEMESTSGRRTSAVDSTSNRRTAAVDSYKQVNTNYSVFEIPSNFSAEWISIATATENASDDERETAEEKEKDFKSDFHGFNLEFPFFVYFVGCVFDGNSVVAHKTFHRYVTRAKAGRKQSSEDGSGKIAHSAGASIRRHNELALKKDIQELLAAWKPYIDASACIFIHASSRNHQLLFNGQTPCFSCHRNVIRHIPLTVRRPTLKEAQRLYKILTQISIGPDEEIVPIIKENSDSTLGKENLRNIMNKRDVSEDGIVENREIVRMSLPLHEAAKAGMPTKFWNYWNKDCTLVSGRTPYRLAEGKEVRNTFRHFMALNMDKWDWGAAKVPGPLTKEMEVSQNAKQAKKDAKRKARANEVKLLRKAREQKAQGTRSSEHQPGFRSFGFAHGEFAGRTGKNTR